MGIAELINKEKKTAFSFEVLPPLKGTGIEKLYATIDTLREFDPLYVNITTHRSEYVYRELGGGLYERNRYRRRPGTAAVSMWPWPAGWVWATTRTWSTPPTPPS